MKMRRINFIRILLAAGIVFGLNACDNDYESVFQETPDERVEQALGEFENLLISAPFGWKASLHTQAGTTYLYYFNFKEGGNVTMMSDFDQTAAGEPMDTEWRLKALQRPTLSFPIYSYIHLPADPDSEVNNGFPGSGLLSDFEFGFTNNGGDTLIMKGLKYQSEMRMVQATQAESEAYHAKRIQELFMNTDEYVGLHRAYQLTLPNGREVPMGLSLEYKLAAFQFIEGDEIKLLLSPFVFSINGIEFLKKANIDGFEIEKLVWDDANHSYYVPLEEPVTLQGIDEPFIMNPPTSLFSRIGHELVTVVIPGEAGSNPLPGHSEAFTDAYNDAATKILEGQYRLTLHETKFVFAPNSNQMFMILTVTQPTVGGGISVFTAQYLYSYQLRDDGTLKFKLENQDQNGNAIYADMLSILSHFDNDTFKVEYVGGGFSLIAGFFSQEEPAYYFSGYLAE